MKIAATILCSVLLLGSSIYYLSFDLSLAKAKLQASRQISREGASKKFKTIVLYSKTGDETGEDEIWYDNKLYDIACSKWMNDSIYYYVLEDNREEEVLSVVNDHFRSEFNALDNQCQKPLIHKILSRQLDQYYFNVLKGADHSSLRIFPSIRFDQSQIIRAGKILSPPPDSFIC